MSALHKDRGDAQEPGRCVVFSDRGNAYDSFDYTPEALEERAAALRKAREPRLVPVMVRGGKVHLPSKYRVYGEYATFNEAAQVVDQLRRDESVAWAYIPDEYADMADEKHAS